MRRRMPTMPGAEHRVRAIERPERLLKTGQRLTQEQFHALYEQTPKHFRADLVNGVVYVSSPLKTPHWTWHDRWIHILHWYKDKTPGVGTGVCPSFIIDDKNEPQPDVVMFIDPECGGRISTTEDEYMTGEPELLCEVADSSKALDLGEKRSAYSQTGSLEYIVVNIPDKKVHLFDLKANQEIMPDEKGILRSRAFPGLWIDTSHFFDDLASCRKTLNRGLASPEHARFVKLLAARRKKKRKRSDR
jgi:putative restriction endonuclease